MFKKMVAVCALGLMTLTSMAETEVNLNIKTYNDLVLELVDTDSDCSIELVKGDVFSETVSISVDKIAKSLVLEDLLYVGDRKIQKDLLTRVENGQLYGGQFPVLASNVEKVFNTKFVRLTAEQSLKGDLLIDQGIDLYLSNNDTVIRGMMVYSIEKRLDAKTGEEIVVRKSATQCL